MNYKKIGWFLGIAFVLFYIIAQPTESVDILRSALGGVGDAAVELADFFRMLVR